MKKKIAVYANGFNIEPLRQALKGIQSFAEKEDMDIFVFLGFASYSEHRDHNAGELNIYHLGHMEDFDGIIVFSNHLNSPETAVRLCQEAKEKNIPVVSVGMPIEGIPCIRFSNEEGMRSLVTHLIEDHRVKRIIFLGGPADHVDNIARLEITKTVLAEHGLTLKEEDIIYGDWGNTAPRKLIEKLLKSRDFPDALVCANDTMAMGAITQFVRNGYSVPDDMIITGFDHSPHGRHYYPALTSVDPNFTQIGYQSCRSLAEQMKGHEVPLDQTVPSLFAHAESCGCTEQPKYINVRKQFCKYSYQHYLESTAIEMFERILLQHISVTDSYKSLKKELQDHFRDNHIFEGRNFYVVINPEYYQDVIAKEEEMLLEGYREPMEAIVALKDGSLCPERMIDRHELIPNYEKREGEQHLYYFLPLHNAQYNYGYVVFADDSVVMQQDMVNPYLEKLQESLKLLRINLRLDGLNKDLIRIYNRDPMTGLYNRLAYEEKADALYEKSLQDKKPLMVMFVDINYMKRINDQYGHLHGDNAIKTVADSIRSVLKDDWVAVRFGGDEFLLIATDCNKEAATQVRHNILSYLEIKNHDGTQPFEISASCGYVITDPYTPSNLQEYVKEADNLMYKIKQEVHARDGKPRYS